MSEQSLNPFFIRAIGSTRANPVHDPEHVCLNPFFIRAIGSTRHLQT